jgi:putative flippase GtrA
MPHFTIQKKLLTCIFISIIINTMVLSNMIKFGIVGLSGMIVDFSITWLLKEKLSLNKYVANSVGFSAAVVNNYLLNRYWTFNSRDSINDEFSRFLVVSIAGLAINNILLSLLIRKWKLNFYVSKVFAILLVFCWNFFVNSYFTFGRS